MKRKGFVKRVWLRRVQEGRARRQKEKEEVTKRRRKYLRIEEGEKERG
jgi:hypothetical protein